MQIIGSSIAALDVSRNQTLQTLDCSGNVSLLDLNVSNNPNLLALDCSSCSLEELDITGCVSLISLDCGENNLESLDMRNGNNMLMTYSEYVRLSNNSLTCVSVDNPEWSETTWANKDNIAVYSSNCATGIQERQRISNDEISAVYDLRGARVNVSELRTKGFYLIRSKDGRTEKRVVSGEF